MDRAIAWTTLVALWVAALGSIFIWARWLGRGVQAHLYLRRNLNGYKTFSRGDKRRMRKHYWSRDGAVGKLVWTPREKSD